LDDVNGMECGRLTGNVRCAHASKYAVFNCSLRSLRIALWSPPTSSSFADEERVCSLLLSTAARDPGVQLLAPLAADRALESAHFVVVRRRKPCLLTPYTLLAQLAEAGACWPLPSSLACDEKRVCLLARPGQRRASPAQHGGARSGVQWLAPLAADRAWSPPTSSSLADEKRVCSLLLSLAARDPGAEPGYA
jgi:hypothetical protein